ncbi:MAG: fascin domain-containing protein [Pseudanabaena sp.]|jgi:hypothetical protein|nr:hypothetical protein [Pseudanabaena sp. M007S1SP1A06QC]MCA6624883.1 hypothetical protein [Pseudanabaena sp. M165S2SP1A06QC]
MPLFVGFKASNGQYVTAEDGGGRELRANRNELSGWETFRINDLNEDQLQHNDVINLIATNGQFVAAEGGGGSLLVANREAPGPWEAFRIVKTQGEGVISNGDQIALIVQNNQFVAAEDGGGRELIANRNELLGWETFVIEFVNAPLPAEQVETFKSKFERLLASGLAQGNRKEARILEFDVNGDVAHYKVELRHHHVSDVPFIGAVTVYDITNTIEGTLDISSPASIANIKICVDVAPQIRAVVGQSNFCVGLEELAAVLF